MGEIKALWRMAGNDARSGVPLAAIRVRNGGRDNGDGMSAISPDFEGINGEPMRLQKMGPLVGYRGG